MAFDTVNVGATANDGTGDTPRAGMQKVNANFTKAVEGPASATSGRLAVYNGATGKLLQNGTKLEADVVTGPASATSGRVAVYNGTTGKVLQNGTKLEADLVTGPASATDGRVVVYDGTTGKLVKNGTKVEADIVTGPASVTAGRIATFDGTTGKLLAQSTLSPGDLLPLAGGTMTGQVVTSLTTLGTTGTLNLDMNGSMLQTTGTLTGNITLTTSNRSAGESVTLRIVNGGTNRTITFPGTPPALTWRYVGTKPANAYTLAANKIAVLTITAFGTNESDIVAAFSVET